MQKNEILEILSGKSENGTSLSVEERIASLPPALIVKAFDTHARVAEKVAQKKTLSDIVCRLLANDMPANEIMIILNVKAEVVDDAVKYQLETITQYAKQLKGRRQRAKNKQQKVDS